MSYKIISVSEEGRGKGVRAVKTKYRVRSDDDNEINDYIVMYWPDMENMIVYDASLDAKMDGFNWRIDRKHRVSATQDYHQVNMENYVMLHIHGTDNDDYDYSEVVHINNIKTDNRLANLRIGSDEDQIHERRQRSERQKPCQELVDAGVQQLPKYVNWNKFGSKFFIQNHPQLVKEVKQGLRKQPYIPGFQNSKLSVLEKYQDILARLDNLQNVLEMDNPSYVLAREYHDICRPVRELLELPNPNVDCIDPRPIPADRKTVSGRRRSDAGLPSDCTITPEMIPKYSYFKPASAARGSAFIIDKHPLLGNQRLSTTSSKSVSTEDKFNELLTMMAQLDQGTIPTKK
jgi:hypothetical protein